MVQGAVPVLDLPLPVVDADHVTVQCDNEICHGNPESRAQSEELWRSMEGPMLSGEHSNTLSNSQYLSELFLISVPPSNKKLPILSPYAVLLNFCGKYTANRVIVRTCFSQAFDC